jgi:hypothetical protein
MGLVMGTPYYTFLMDFGQHFLSLGDFIQEKSPAEGHLPQVAKTRRPNGQKS